MPFFQIIADGRQSYVTLATNDEYAIGALILGHSLRDTKTDRELTILITEGVPHSFRELLQSVYDNLIIVKPQHSRGDHCLHLLRRPDLGVTYTKLFCWKLLEFQKCVFLDADTIVLQNIDELFQREELSAAPDTSWPDIFNSGVFVYRPSLETFYELSFLAKNKSSFDGGDQGLLNEYFNTWGTETLDKHLPFSYNCSCWVLPNDNLMFYARPAAWKKFGSRVKVAHFTGYEKPWKHRMAANDDAIRKAIERLECSDTAYTTAEEMGVLALWWAIFFKRVKHQLSYGMFLSTTFEPVPPPPPSPQDDYSDERQEQNDLWGEIQNYHPEFNDTSFDFMHSGQRVDESNRYEEYHEHFEPPKPPEPEHHKYYESRKPEYVRHELRNHQPVYNEPRCPHEYPPAPAPSEPQHDRYNHKDDQPHFEDIVFQPYLPERRHEPPPSPSQEYDHHHQRREYHQEHHYEHFDHQRQQEQPQQQWQEQPPVDHQSQSQPTPPMPQIEPLYGQHREEIQDSRQPYRPPSLPRELLPPPLQRSPSPKPLLFSEPRNDKDPLFFVPKPMCRECLRELQWSRQFVDPFHRDIASPLSPKSTPQISESRVRRRSHQLWPLGTQVIHGVLKNPPPLVIQDEDLTKTNGREQKKKEKGKERSLHQVQKGRSVPKKRSKKPIDRSRLLDAAKGRTQAKIGSTSPSAVISLAVDMNNRLIEPIGDLKSISTKPDVISTDNGLVDMEAKPQSAGLKLPLAQENALIESKTEAATEDKLVEWQQKLEAIAPPASATRAKRQSKVEDSSEKAAIGQKVANVEATPAKRRMKSAELEQETRPPAEVLVPKDIKAVLTPAESSMEQQPPSQKSETCVATEEATRSALLKLAKLDGVVEPIVKKPAVKPAPWLPRPKIMRNQDQKKSPEHEYFCDRHRPHPPPPEWRMSAWERGEIDYMGSDRFCNILARIRSTIQQSEDDALPIGIWL